MSLKYFKRKCHRYGSQMYILEKNKEDTRKIICGILFFLIKYIVCLIFVCIAEIYISSEEGDRESFKKFPAMYNIYDEWHISVHFVWECDTKRTYIQSIYKLLWNREVQRGATKQRVTNFIRIWLPDNVLCDCGRWYTRRADTRYIGALYNFSSVLVLITVLNMFDVHILYK